MSALTNTPERFAVAVIAIAMCVFALASSVGSAASSVAASGPPLGAPLAECEFSFEGTTEGWEPQPANCDGWCVLTATPVAAHPYCGQYSLQINFEEGSKGAVGVNNPPTDYCPPAVVRARVYADSSAASDVWIQLYLLDQNWTWRDSGPGKLLKAGQWVLLEWDLSQYTGLLACPLRRLGVQFGHNSGGGRDTFFLDAVGFGPSMPTNTPTLTATATRTPSNTPTKTPTASATATRTPSATSSASSTPSPTATWTPSVTSSPSPTATSTSSRTPSPSRTATWLPSPTNTPTATTVSPTNTPTASATPSPTATNTRTPTSLPEPEPNQVYLGAFLPDIAQAADLNRNSGKHHGIQMRYVAFAYNNTPTVFPGEWVRAVLRSGATPMLTVEPWDPFYPTAITLAQINSGQWDAYLTSFAQAARDMHYPLYLRFAHEMNGNWYPWSGDPVAYQQAWRRVQSIFTQVGAKNVHWVWSINAENVPADNHYSRYYPGDDLADVIGVDGYNWGAKATWSPPPPCKSFSQIFDAPLTDLAQRYPGKVLMVTEFATACDNNCDKTIWISDAYRSVKRYPAVKAMIWFSEAKYEGSTWVDWRPWCAAPDDVTSPATCAACFTAYRDTVSDPYFRADAPLNVPRSWVFLPLVLRAPEPTPTPSPTATATASPTQTPSPSPTPMPVMIEDFERGLTDWSNPYGDLDVFQLTNDACRGTHTLRIGGVDQDNSWVGAAVLSRWGSRPQDWQGKQALTLCVKRGDTRRGGRPALTVIAVDRNNYGVVLHRNEDQYLSWPGGGWRTIVNNDTWSELVLPLRGEAGFDWAHVTGLRIEVRRTWSSGWEVNPDDVYIDRIQLR